MRGVVNTRRCHPPSTHPKQRLNISKDVKLPILRALPRFPPDTSFPRATLPTQEAKTSNPPRVSIQKHRENAIARFANAKTCFFIEPT